MSSPLPKGCDGSSGTAIPALLGFFPKSIELKRKKKNKQWNEFRNAHFCSASWKRFEISFALNNSSNCPLKPMGQGLPELLHYAQELLGGLDSWEALCFECFRRAAGVTKCLPMTWNAATMGHKGSTHLQLLRPLRFGGCASLLALPLRFGADALPLGHWDRWLRGSFGQRLLLCWHRWLLLWGRAGGPALLGCPQAPGRGRLLLGRCRRLSRGRCPLRGCCQLVPWGAARGLLWRGQRHRGRVRQAPFQQPLGLAVQTQPFVFLQDTERKRCVRNRCQRGLPFSGAQQRRASR